MQDRNALNSPSEPDQPPIRPRAEPSDAELESIRRNSIRVLGSVAAALEAAEHQKQTLLADVEAAQQTLLVLANERESAEASLADSRAELDEAEIRLERAEIQRIGLLREVEDLRSDSLQRRAALAAEIVALERQRDEFTRVVVRPPGALSAATPQPVVALWPSAWLVGIRTLGTNLQHVVLVHPVHPGFSNVATALFIALLLAMALLLSPLTQVFGGLQLLSVTSGSMAPGVPTGSMVGVRPVPASDLRVGDVITFANLNSPDVLVTHRIVSLDASTGQTMLTTKGDANDAVDALSAPASRALGRVEFALPWLGGVMLWLGSPAAKIVSVCLAAVALALSVASVRHSTRHSLVAH